MNSTVIVNESQLRQMIAESVKNTLNEWIGDGNDEVRMDISKFYTESLWNLEKLLNITYKFNKTNNDDDYEKWYTALNNAQKNIRTAIQSLKDARYFIKQL